MFETYEFAHGTYGDLSGIKFHGAPSEGFWLDYLEVSDFYIRPLFLAILKRCWREPEKNQRLPRIPLQWNCDQGCWAIDSARKVTLWRADAEELMEALDLVTHDDLTPETTSPGDCLRCAKVIQAFLRSRLERGIALYIERD